MIKFKKSNILFEIEESIIIIIFSSILSSVIRNYFENYFMCFLFVIFHELSHIAIANFFYLKPEKIKIKLSGMNAQYSRLDISKFKKIIIFISGPIANLLLAILFNNIKFVFEINIALCFVNLIPIFPLDGFNIIKILFNNKVKYIEKSFKILIIFMSLYLIYKYNNYSLIILIIYVLTIGINVEKY